MAVEGEDERHGRADFIVDGDVNEVCASCAVALGEANLAAVSGCWFSGRGEPQP